MLPTIKIGNTDVTRLIVGGNPFSGFSHWDRELDWQMRDYFTAAKIKEVLFRCRENGMNTMLLRGDMHIMRLIHEFRQEGGDLHWICMSASEFDNFDRHVNQVVQYKPAAMYHHGSVTDAMFKRGEFDELKRRIAVMKDKGLTAGLGTHMPEVMEYAEEHDWGVDFYMSCVYNISLDPKPGKTGERFEEEDIPVMYEMIRKIQKPCLAFKILGAGRRCATQQQVQAAFIEAYRNIKDTDGVVVGMYPKNEDQPRLDAEYARNALAALGK